MNAPPAAGTALARRRDVPAPRFDAIRAAHFRVAVNEWIRSRPYRTAPSWLVTTTLLWVAGFSRARIALIVATQLLLLGYYAVQATRARRGAPAERALFVSHLVFITAQALIVTLTGGFTSPLWPALVAASMAPVYVFGRSRESNVTIGYTALVVLVIAALPAPITGPPLARPFHIALAAWSILFALFILRASAYALSDAHQRTGETLEKMREDVIEAAEERQRSLEMIGSKVAHELKNPLAAIKGLVQLLARSEETPRGRERLEVMSGEVTRMETILRDYLSFSRPLEDLRPQEVDLAALADDVLAVLEARAEAAGITLTRAGADVAVAGDPRRLKEALLNLVANAVEATPRGGSVEVALTTADGGADVVVRDTGRGIKTEDLARVGTPFFTTREGGTGLGVVLARAVVRQHGGDLAIESAIGRGTTVRFHLPARCPNADARAHG